MHPASHLRKLPPCKNMASGVRTKLIPLPRVWAYLESSILQRDMGKNPLSHSPRSDQLSRTVSIWPSVSLYPSRFLPQFNSPLVSVYWAYLALRVYGVYAHSKGPSVGLCTILFFTGKWAMAAGIDLLAVITCVRHLPSVSGIN